MEKFSLKPFQYIQRALWLCLLFSAWHANSIAFTNEIQIEENRITLELENVSLSQVIKALNAQNQKFFIFNEDDLKHYPKANYKIDNKTIDQALKTVLQNTEIEYVIEDEVVILKSRPSSNVLQQSTEIVAGGYVRDESGQSIVGV